MTLAHDETTGGSVTDLGRVECLELLGRAGIGRVVISADCIPVAFPVNVSVSDGDVVFATDPKSDVDFAVRGHVVTIEADEIDRVHHAGWSVLVTGIASIITDPDERQRVGNLLTQTWSHHSVSSLVRIPATHVSGRRLTWDHRAAITEPP